MYTNKERKGDDVWRAILVVDSVCDKISRRPPPALAAAAPGGAVG